VAGLESDCLFKANERMVLRIYLTTLTVDDLSDMTLYPKVRLPQICKVTFRNKLIKFYNYYQNQKALKTNMLERV
jgi:hypothetical protein